MNSQSAYLLVFHGSRDSRPASAVESLAHMVQRQLQQRYSLAEFRLASISAGPDSSIPAWAEDAAASTRIASISTLPLQIGTACLELGPAPLHQQIQQFSCDSSTVISTIQVLPLFLLPGVHVKEDIPQEVAIAQTTLRQTSIKVRPYLGSHPGLINLLRTQMQRATVDAWILLSHGSRRTAGNQPVEAIAIQLAATPAYWSVPPDLASCVTALVQQGHTRIGILPYFLFPGGITDAIAQTVDQLRQKFSAIHFHLAEPLGATPELAALATDLLID